MKIQNPNNKQLKKSKKTLNEIKRTQYANKNRNVVSYLTKYDSENNIEILVTQNECRNNAVTNNREKLFKKIFNRLYLFFEKKFKFQKIFLVLFFFLCLICYNLLIIHSLKQELSKIKLQVDKLSNNNFTSKINDTTHNKVNLKLNFH